MSVEIEAKYKVSGEKEAGRIAADKELAPFVSYVGERRMSARYFDTEDMKLSGMGAALRIRYEDGVGVCCLKLSREDANAVSEREEYEGECEGLPACTSALRASGAPEEIVSLIEKDELCEICRTDFTRQIWMCRKDGLAVEMAFDRGKISSHNLNDDICELEFEKKCGEDGDFFDFIKKTEREFSLVPESRSKFSRGFDLYLRARI